MKKILTLAVLIGGLTQSFSQNVFYEIDVDQLYYSESGCGDQSAGPDPVWKPRFNTNGSQYDWTKALNDITFCGWQAGTNNYSMTPTIYGSATNNIVFSFDGYEDDGWFPDDAKCNGYAVLRTIPNICDYPPYIWNYFTDSRNCTSDGTTGTYQVKWSYYWGYNQAPTIVTQPVANTVVCNGSSVTLTVEAGTDACGRNMGLHYQWEYSNNTSCIGATNWQPVPSSDNATLTIPPGTFTGTRVYRVLVTSNNTASFTTNTTISNCVVVTINPMAIPPSIISAICGGTVLPGGTYPLGTLQPPAVGAVTNIDNYSWTATGGTFSPASSGANLTNVSWTAPTTPGSYTVTVEYQDNCGNVSSADCQINVAESNCDFTYVSPSGTDNPGCGGPGNPCKTLTGTDGALAKGGNYIRMENGNYTEPGIAVITTNMIIEGRYVRTGSTWVKNSNTASSTSLTFSGEESPAGVRHRMGLKANNVNNWKLIDLDITTTNITGQDANHRGASNYGVWINSSSNYEISRCKITSGNAGDGQGRNNASGFDGSSAQNAGTTGGAIAGNRGYREAGNGGSGGNGGNPGANASIIGTTTATSGGGGGGGGTGGSQKGGGNNNCSGCDNGGSGGGGGGQAGNPSGGAGAINTGSDGNQPGGKKGGNGTDGGIGPGNDDFNASPYSSAGKIYPNGGAGGGTPSAAGSGGKGGGGRTARCNGSQNPAAEAGTNGSNGNNGTNATTTIAATYGSYFIPGKGNDGTAGQGGGGGGGGGAGGCDADWDDEDGSAGHGGGGGGGGGGAGAGGFGGGGSFTIFQDGTSSGNIFNSIFSSGIGGAGGIGGIGGNGGTGASGASGYNPAPASDSPIGGNGGNGGNGGKGGNGANGPSGTSAQMVTNGVVSSPSTTIPNSPIVQINYKNTKICSNSVVEIEKNTGNWSITNPWSFVKYENTVLASQYTNASSPAEIYTTNTSGSSNLVTDGATYHSYLTVLENRPAPVITIKAHDGSTLTPAATICDGGTVQLTASSYGNEIEFQWDVYAGTKADQKGAASTAIFSSQQQAPVTTGLPQGTYFVRYQVREQCCGWSIPVFATITVNPQPTPPTNFNLTAGPVCVGTTINASNAVGGTGGVPSYTYEWDYETNLHPFSSFSTTPPSFPAEEGANVVVVRIAADGIKGCNASDTIQKIVIGENGSTSVASVTADSPTYCVGNNVTLTANGGMLGTNAVYNWYAGATCTGTPLASGTSNIYTTTAQPGSTTYSVTISSNACGATACESIIINNQAPSNTLAINLDVATCPVNNNNWIHFYNNNGRLLVSVNSHGQDLGNVSATCYAQTPPINVSSCDGSIFTDVLGRRWVITPEYQPTGSVDVRLYYDEPEYQALVPVANSNANMYDDVSGYSSLQLTKFTENTAGHENGSFTDDCGFGSFTLYNPVAVPTHVIATDIPDLSLFAPNGRYSQFAIGSFSEFWLHGSSENSPLPIELTSYSVECLDKGISLTWKTLTETNVSHFEILRSRDGNTWDFVKKINAAGNSTSPKAYSYLDANINGLLYYKLVSVDFDGERNEYGPISSNCMPTEPYWNIKPIPVVDNATITIVSMEEMQDVMEIYDATGRIVKSQKVQLTVGENLFQMDLSHLNTGTYVIRLKDYKNIYKPIRFVKF